MILLAVQIPEIDQCGMGEIEVTSKQGYLSNYIAHTTSCGSVSSPWIIYASPGQHVVLSLYDFTLATRTYRPDPGGREFSPSACHHIFATVEDLGIRESICDQQTKHRAVYTSKGHEISVSFEIQDGDNPNYILLHYASM